MTIALWLLFSVLSFLAGCLVGYAMTQAPHVARIVTVGWKYRHHNHMDPEAAPINDEWDALVGQ